MADQREQRFQIKADQIKGIHGGSLYDDIDKLIHDVFGEYKTPVPTFNDLPMTDEIGSTRFVSNEAKYYQLTLKKINNVEQAVWEAIPDLKIESREVMVPVNQDDQTIFTIDLEVGILNGVANINSVEFIVNGIKQNRGLDFIAYKNPSNKLEIEWKSTDFKLETSDEIQVVYDTLTQ